MGPQTQERLDRLSEIYNPAFGRVFEIFNLGTSDSPVRDAEILELGSRAGLARNSVVLEPCSGTGGVSRLLAREFGCRVCGVDLVPYQLMVAQKKAVQRNLQHLVSYAEGDVVYYSFKPEHYDAAVDVFAWVHIAEWPAWFGKLRKALKPGGRLLLYDAFITPKTTRDTEREVKDKWFDPGICTVDECVGMLEGSGYKVSYREERRKQVLANWSAGLNNLRLKQGAFVSEFGEDVYRLFYDTVSWTIQVHEREGLTAAMLVAEKV